VSHRFEFFIGAEQVKAFADLVGDHNPVHLDAEFAATTRYKVPICHGLLVASYLSSCMVKYFGEGTIYVEQNLRFRRPVPVGSTIEIQFTDLVPGEKGQVQLATSVSVKLDAGWKVCLEGSAIVVPGNPSLVCP